MNAVKIEDVKNGEFIRRKPDAKTTFVRGSYIRAEKRYECMDDEDINRYVYLKKGTVVYTGFTY